jgi:hypothetical protein
MCEWQRRNAQGGASCFYESLDLQTYYKYSPIPRTFSFSILSSITIKRYFVVIDLSDHLSLSSSILT